MRDNDSDSEIEVQSGGVRVVYVMWPQALFSVESVHFSKQQFPEPK